MAGSSRAVFCILSFSLILAACGSERVSYKDHAALEKPPILAVDKQSEEQMRVVDESVVSAHEDKHAGMGDKVFITDTKPPVLHIKQAFAGAWKTVAQALLQKDINITDQEKEKGLYYVSYEKPGFFEGLSSYFKNEGKGPIYLLTLTDDDQETTVVASLANQAEQDATDRQKGAGTAGDGAAELLQLVYQTMRDELIKASPKEHRARKSRNKD